MERKRHQSYIRKKRNAVSRCNYIREDRRNNDDLRSHNISYNLVLY